ncbi:hypothetical protein ABZU75_21280 [Streptosporangium sp. NPDC005286]|uniref:hypothetical protein n=1 Tax=Streptosporangium sp. NPDC005286 TaxID=3154463 RepID=UPI0033A99C2D
MSHRTRRSQAPTFRTLRRIRRYRPPERLLFGGVYGTVLASGLAAALDRTGTAPDPGYDALWVLISALAAAVVHGYAYAVANHTAADQPTAHTVRSVLGEWPLVAATLPTLGAHLGAYAGWWKQSTAVDVVLVFNAVTLFGWGLWASRVSGGSWRAACRAGGVYTLLGLLIIVANTFVK